MLKGLLILAGILTAAPDAHADCGCGTELLTPTIVEGTSQIVLETSCPPRAPKITLEDAAGIPTAFRITATHVGHRSVQFVIEPLSPLAPGAYRVVLHRDGREPHPLRVVSATKTATTPAPAAPRVVSQIELERGCGPVKSVNIALATLAPLAFVELTDTRTGKQASGFVPIRNGAMTIGHHMCSGAFALERARSYIASITLVVPEHGTSSTARALTFTYSP